MSMNPAVPVEREEKEKALALVESSETFAKHGQLKAFLRFVCEYEISGRGDELHEYLIGTEVMGKPTGYSTTDDSIVRNRAHSLRQKLQGLYALEAPDASIRIEIPKGSYCPRFVRVVPRESTDRDSTAGTAFEKGRSRRRFKGTAIFVIAGVAACIVSGFVGRQLAANREEPAIAPVIREAWGPILGPHSNAILCIATTPQLLVRSRPEGFAGGDKPVPKEWNLDAWYSQHYKERTGERLGFQPNFNSPLWGDAYGAISIDRVLTKAGTDVQILPERVVNVFALRGRNVILLGRPEQSPAADLFLNGLYYNLKFFDAIQDQEVYYPDPQTGVPKELAHKDGIVHGLITVIGTSNPKEGSTRLVVISGANSAGTSGAAEFFSSPERMAEFKARLLKDGYKPFPTTYQIVISTESTETSSALPYRSWIETYKVITP
jgi:hypothetical protein